jgi:hypothetical protein
MKKGTIGIRLLDSHWATTVCPAADRVLTRYLDDLAALKIVGRRLLPQHLLVATDTSCIAEVVEQAMHACPLLL